MGLSDSLNIASLHCFLLLSVFSQRHDQIKRDNESLQDKVSLLEVREIEAKSPSDVLPIP